MSQTDNIIALATAPGIGAIALIRISGSEALPIVAKHFRPVGAKKLLDQKSHTVHLGHIMEGTRELDQVLVTIFKEPNSYTGENIVEISCHGSPYIQREILHLFLRNGCRMAKEGEFTLRAFLNAKMDLSQAEAVADLIASDSAGAHRLAMQQMRGGFSTKIIRLRQELLDFASLIELELDFSQEDVEFADRTQFKSLLDKIEQVLKKLIDSFALGNAIKNGIPVAIVGDPNVGKSTLLNALLNEERAIVSDIPGTTRDTVEDQISIKGINFRFIDTAGIRRTKNKVEQIGIKKAFEKIENADLVLYLFEAGIDKSTDYSNLRRRFPKKLFLPVANKSEKLNTKDIKTVLDTIPETLPISAKTGKGIEVLRNKLLEMTTTGEIGKSNIVITNSRHYDALQKALQEVEKVKEGLQIGVSSDLIAIDIRQTLFHLGEITGSVTTDDLLGNIFSNFCIGK